MNWTPGEIKDWITTEHIRAEKERLACGMDSCGCELCQNLNEPPQVVDVPVSIIPEPVQLPLDPVEPFMKQEDMEAIRTRGRPRKEGKVSRTTLWRRKLEKQNN